MWLLNLHGIRMAVLWVSGRTALVLTLAAVLAATALVRGRLLPALAWLAVALLAKEEAVLLPAILLAWISGSVPADEPAPVRPVSWIGGAGIVTALYFLARSMTQAMTPMSAPPFYTPTFDLAALWSNIVSYADRALTFPLVVALLAVVLLGRPHPWMDRRTLTLFRVRCGVARRRVCADRLSAGPFRPVCLFPIGRRRARRGCVLRPCLGAVDTDTATSKPDRQPPRLDDRRRASLFPHRPLGRDRRFLVGRDGRSAEPRPARSATTRRWSFRTIGSSASISGRPSAR